jgi:uncharacterized protein (DUF4415 family)
MSGSRGKIKYSKIPKLDESYLDTKNHKVRITMWLDGDILEVFRDMAKKSGIGYQTLINNQLRRFTTQPDQGSIEERLERLEQIIKKKRA